MNRPFDDEQFDPRLNRLAGGEAPADVQARARAALTSLRDKMDRVETQKESLIMKIFANRWARLGWAGSLAVVLFVCYIVFGPNKSGVAFAEVAARLHSFKTMVYTGVAEINPNATDEFAKTVRTTIKKFPQGSTTVYYKGPMVRQDMMGGMGYAIFDIEKKKAISVTPIAKMYMEMDMSDTPLQPADNIERLRTMPTRADRALGNRKIDGKTLCGFIVTQNGLEQTVWVDAMTGLPARIEIPIPQSPGSRMVLKDFKFDVPLEDSLFDMKIPEGYTRLQMKVELPTEQDLLNLFKEWTDADPNHEFPATFSMFTMTQMPPTMKDKLDSKFPDSKSTQKDGLHSKTAEDDKITTAAALKAFQDELKANPKKMQGQMDKMMKMMKPFQFPSTVEERGGEWHYAGKGVKFGEARPVCWWKQKKSDTTWRVIYGDLTIGDMPQEDMAKFLDSIKRIDNATSAPAQR